MSRSFRILAVAMVFGSGVMPSGCGRRAKAKSQEQIKVPLPANPEVASTGLFGLTPVDGSADYLGTLVAFADQPPAPALAKLIVAARELRLEHSRYFTFRRDSQAALKARKTELTEAQHRWETLKAEEIAAADASEDATVTANRQIQADQWLAHALASVSDESVKTQANQVFEAYCDAKVWELAVSRELITQTFVSRPSPQALCETYYRAHGLFAENDNAGPTACHPSRIGNSTDAVLCLWQQGVMKTPWMTRLDGTGQPVGRDISEKYVQGGDDSIIVKALKDETSASDWRSIVLSQKNGRIASLNMVVKFTVTKDPDVASIRKNTPFSLLADIETETGMAPIFPRALDNVRWDLRFFGERFGGSPSESDVSFHRLQGQSVRSVVHSDGVVANEARLRADFDGVLKKIVIDHSRSDAAQRDLDTLKAALATLESETAAKENALQDTKDRQVNAAIEAANSPGLAQAFVDLKSFRVVRRGDVMAVNLLVRSAGASEASLPVRGCVRMSNSEAVPCGATFPEYADTQEKVISASALHYDSTLGTISLSLGVAKDDGDVASVANIGIVPVPRVTSGPLSYFSDLSPEVLRGGKWVWKLFPNRIGDMNILTGDVSFYDTQGKLSFLGSLSLYQTAVSSGL